MVEIQPYEFKKKTNIEEHNDIVSKVNEIVDVINDTQMDTIDSRLTAVEGDVTALESEVSTINNELDTKANKTEIPDTSTFATKTEVDAVDTKVDAIDSQLDTMQTEIDGKLSSVPIGGTNIGGVKNGGNVTINADGTMNASGTGTGITQNVLTYAGNKLKSTVNGVESNEVEIVAGGSGVSSVVVTNPAPGNITVNVDGKSGNADIDTLASGIEVYGSEFPPDSGNASAYIKLNDSISTGEIGKYTESGTSFIRIGNEDTRLLADTVELRNEAPDEGCKLTSGYNGELMVNGVAMKNYTLPVGGTALGGVKNGGNVTIDAEGNMNASATIAFTPISSIREFYNAVKNDKLVFATLQSGFRASFTGIIVFPNAYATNANEKSKWCIGISQDTNTKEPKASPTFLTINTNLDDNFTIYGVGNAVLFNHIDIQSIAGFYI